jgi:glycogen synthase
MRIFLKLSLFLMLIFFGCENGKDYNYYKIEVFNKSMNALISTIEDSLVINSFEKELKSLKKEEYLKNPYDYQYFIKCYSKDTVDIYFINESYIGKKDGVYPSKVNFLRILSIE